MKIRKFITATFLALTLISSPVLADSVLSPLTDSVNSGIINTKIAADDMLTNTDIDATVVNGIAIYSGVVNSKAQLNELLRIAHSVSGIKGIDISRLKVLHK
jgi:osmotically-inducible protein OsmY